MKICDKSTNEFQVRIYRNKNLPTPGDNEKNELILTVPSYYGNDISWSTSPNGNYISYQCFYIGKYFIYDIEAKKYLPDTRAPTGIFQLVWSGNLNKFFYIVQDENSESWSLSCHTIGENTLDDIQIIRHKKDRGLFYIGKDNKEELIRADVSNFAVLPIKNGSYENSEAFFLGLSVTDNKSEKGKELYIL